MGSRGRALVVAVVTLHAVLLAVYTLPATGVAPGMQHVARMYARPLFHQQWRLFAPDPPLCDCTLQVAQDDGWTELPGTTAGVLQHRAGRNLCRYVQAAVQAQAPIPGELDEALAALGAADRAMRLVERCVMDPLETGARQEHITMILRP